MLLLTCTSWGQDSRNLELLDAWHAHNLVPDGTSSLYNEVWGFEQNGVEYAVIGSQNGTHILKVENNGELAELFFVQGASYGPYVVNRDFANYKGYLYSICDQGYATLQIIDISNLPNAISVVYDDDTLFGRAHTIWFDEAVAKMYVGGPAGYAMKVFDVSDPLSPDLKYTHNDHAYIHDMYVRNDTAFLNAAYEGLQVYNFSNMTTPYQYTSFTAYTDIGYNHSGKLSADGKWYVFADETSGSKVKLLNVSDLTDINEVAVLSSGGDANTVAHDPIFWKDFVFVAYYYDGLVVFDIRDKNNPKKIAWFDSYSGINSAYKGVWGVFILPSGKVLISDRQNGLFCLRFNEPPPIESNVDFGVFPNPIIDYGYFYYNNTRNLSYNIKVYNAQGELALNKNINSNFMKISSLELASGVYSYVFTGIDNTATFTGKFVVL